MEKDKMLDGVIWLRELFISEHSEAVKNAEEVEEYDTKRLYRTEARTYKHVITMIEHRFKGVLDETPFLDALNEWQKKYDEEKTKKEQKS